MVIGFFDKHKMFILATLRDMKRIVRKDRATDSWHTSVLLRMGLGANVAGVTICLQSWHNHSGSARTLLVDRQHPHQTGRLAVQPHQQGFNLIEVMIVVAIIGILAVIAIPRYQDYVNRAKMTEAFMVFARLKSDVAEFHTHHGRLPLHNELSSFATPGRQSPYVVAIEINNVPGTAYNERNNPAIRIIVKMDPKQFAGMSYQSNQMMFTADTRGLNGGIAWSCGPRDVSAVKRAWLPSTCHD